MDAPTLEVYGALHPLDRGNAAGADHLVVTAPLASGRLRRNAGDALCKPAHKFWDLFRENRRANAASSWRGVTA